MKLGLQIPSFTWPGGDAAIATTLARVVQTADEVGFDSIWVMDHFYQIRSVGRPEEPMLEGWATLGYAAALTRRARLGLLVGGIHYRQAGLWAKLATTLDVLTGGRTYFGIGAAWNEEESKGLGFPMPPLHDRFEMLEETLRFVLAMWQGERGSGEAFAGHHYRADRLLNSPQAIQRPHPPILIGGGGERKTLRLVAQYGDATNVFGSADTLRHKYAVLRAHCEEVGRAYASIERSNLNIAEIEPQGPAARDSASRFLDRAVAWAEAGSQHAIVSIPNVWDVRKLEVLGRLVIPQLRSVGEPSPIG
jgi:F420-dependent oxidoreductase-like protein